MVQYPGDFAAGDTGQWVAHFAHPLEMEWSCRQVPPPGKWPVVYFQVRVAAACWVGWGGLAGPPTPGGPFALQPPCWIRRGGASAAWSL
jgi:hypothetical protein